MTKMDPKRAFLRRTEALVALVALVWAVQVVNWIAGYGLNSAFSLILRQISGLDGVIVMPLLHGSFAHLMANVAPLLVTGGLLVATTKRALLPVNVVVIDLGAGLVWLFRNSAIDVGASGLVFAGFGFFVARGLVDGCLITLGAALVVGALYGSILWGVLPASRASLGRPTCSERSRAWLLHKLPKHTSMLRSSAASIWNETAPPDQSCPAYSARQCMVSAKLHLTVLPPSKPPQVSTRTWRPFFVGM